MGDSLSGNKYEKVESLVINHLGTVHRLHYSPTLRIRPMKDQYNKKTKRPKISVNDPTNVRDLCQIGALLAVKFYRPAARRSLYTG